MPCAINTTYLESKREGITPFNALERIQKYHIMRDLQGSYERTLSFILKILKTLGQR